MSSFICSNDTINKVLAAMFLDQWPTDLQRYQMGKRLAEMNDNAYAYRYKVNSGSAAFSDKHHFLSMHDVQMGNGKVLIPIIKSMECYLYQCSEGNIPESSLYKEVKAKLNELREAYIQSTQEYKSAPWE